MKETNKWAPPVIRINGRYANFFKVGRNAFEFVFDFGQSQGEPGDASIHTRIVTSPGYAKTFMKTLRESIEQYEMEFEHIKTD